MIRLLFYSHFLLSICSKFESSYWLSSMALHAFCRSRAETEIQEVEEGYLNYVSDKGKKVVETLEAEVYIMSDNVDEKIIKEKVD